MKFKVGGLTPEEDAVRFRQARAARGRRLRPRGRREPGLDAGARRSASPGWSRTSTSCGSRSRASGRTTGARCATCARGGCPGLRRPERVLRGRLPRPDGDRVDRLLQLRLVVVGRPDRVATGRRHGGRLRRADGAPRGAADRRAPAGVDPARHVPRVLPSHARPDLVEPHRQPPGPRGRAITLPTGPGLGWELDEDYISKYRIAFD